MCEYVILFLRRLEGIFHAIAYIVCIHLFATSYK